MICKEASKIDLLRAVQHYMIVGFSYEKEKKSALTSYVSFFTKRMREKKEQRGGKGGGRK